MKNESEFGNLTATNLMDRLKEVDNNFKYCEIRTLINDSIIDLYKSISIPFKDEYSKKLSKLAKKIMEVANGK